RLDPSKIQIAKLERSYNCPFAKHIRKRLAREYKIKKGFPVIFSSELANPESVRLTDGSNFKKSFYGTSAWIPAAFGLHAASYAVRKLAGLL
ncbi:MAG: tRNA threonylcarbamoyladenosine dehydratase, partial [Flavobacteriia bacterium]|nr:tRNA threonylcarbamoyladenosine dehydratase [Flavobacteriia bacterium]